MGVKKSTVCTSAVSGAIWYTPASSAWSKPTRTFGSCCRANFPSTLSSAAGLSLDAQPAAFTDSVRRNGFTSGTGSFYADQEHSPQGARGNAGKSPSRVEKRVCLRVVWRSGISHDRYHHRTALLDWKIGGRGRSERESGQNRAPCSTSGWDVPSVHRSAGRMGSVEYSDGSEIPVNHPSYSEPAALKALKIPVVPIVFYPHAQ